MDIIKLMEEEDIVGVINNHQDELFNLIPELKFMVDFNQHNPHHHLDVWQHTLYALKMSEKNIYVRLSLLFHDIGKPFSYQEEDNIWHFYNHPEVSYQMTKKILSRLDINLDKELICWLVRNHDRPIKVININDDYKKYKLLYEIQRCDALAHHPDKLEKRIKYLHNIKKYL